MSQSTKVKGMKVTISCEIPYSIAAGGSTDYEVTYSTPEWSVVGTLGSYSVTNTYTTDYPNEATILSDLIADLTAKINDVGNTQVALATELMEVMNEMLNSDTIADAFATIVNVEHKAAYALYSAFETQIVASSGVYSSVNAPTEPTDLQAATSLIVSNTTLSGSTSYNAIEQFLE